MWLILSGLISLLGPICYKQDHLWTLYVVWELSWRGIWRKRGSITSVRWNTEVHEHFFLYRTWINLIFLPSISLTQITSGYFFILVAVELALGDVGSLGHSFALHADRIHPSYFPGGQALFYFSKFLLLQMVLPWFSISKCFVLCNLAMLGGPR